MNLGVFLWSCVFFWRLASCLFLGLFQLKFACFWACVFQTSFFQVLWYFCSFNLLLQAYWACFCENFLILGLFFQICLPAFLFNFHANFLFHWFFLPTHVGLVFWFNYVFLACISQFTCLFLQNNLASLLPCFYLLLWIVYLDIVLVL